MAEDKSNKVQISFRVQAPLKRAWDVKLAQDGKEQQAILTAFLSEYLGGKWEHLQIDVGPPSKPKRNERWHDLLELVLAHGTKKQVEWLSGNLLTFAELIQLKNPDMDLAAPVDGQLAPEEARLVEEYRQSSFEKRRRMLSFVAKQEDLGPEVMPSSRKRAGGKS